MGRRIQGGQEQSLPLLKRLCPLVSFDKNMRARQGLMESSDFSQSRKAPTARVDGAEREVTNQ